MKINTNELKGAALDWAVAKCEGVEFTYENHPQHELLLYNYSTDWAQGGPIIEREEISLTPKLGGWTAEFVDEYSALEIVWSDGETALIAAMRCFCCAKLGEEVEIPEELRCGTE